MPCRRTKLDWAAWIPRGWIHSPRGNTILSHWWAIKHEPHFRPITCNYTSFVTAMFSANWSTVSIQDWPVIQGLGPDDRMGMLAVPLWVDPAAFNPLFRTIIRRIDGIWMKPLQHETLSVWICTFSYSKALNNSKMWKLDLCLASLIHLFNNPSSFPWFLKCFVT